MIQSVQRAAQILAVLGSGTPRLGVTEIADRVGLAKPTVHGLLRTLEAHELVAQDPDTGKYSLGPGVLQLGNAYLDGSDLRARSLRRCFTASLLKRPIPLQGAPEPRTLPFELGRIDHDDVDARRCRCCGPTRSGSGSGSGEPAAHHENGPVGRT